MNKIIDAIRCSPQHAFLSPAISAVFLSASLSATAQQNFGGAPTLHDVDVS
jgi:hypothetical protein